MTKHSLKAFEEIPLSPQRFRHIGNHVIDLVERALDAAADQRGGELSRDEINMVLEMFRDTPQGLWDFYQKAFDLFIKATETQKLVTYERRNLLLRLVVSTFEHELVSRAPNSDAGGSLSRGIIGPIEKTLEVMLGTDILEHSRQACREIVEDLVNQLGDGFTWQPFYADRRAKIVLIDVCAGLARHFGNFDSRMEWFINMLNRHAQMAGPDGAPTGNDDDVYGEPEFLLVMNNLMGKAEALLADKATLSGPGAPSEEDADIIRALCARLKEHSAG